MVTITFTIPNDKLPNIVDAMKGLYPIPQINTGTKQEPVWENEFTDNAWAKECIRRWVIEQVAGYNQKTAQDAIAYEEDNNLLT